MGAVDYLVVKVKSAVIVIDDDPSVLRSLQRLISGAGFDVRTFDRPTALLKSDLPRSGACLIIDLHLPEMNGVELCENLAAAGRLLPVVLITGHVDEATRENVRRARAVAVLIKPFSRGLLMNAISKALRSGISG